MKNFFRSVHLYLALAAGVVILISCFTGAVLVFESELQQAFNHDRYFVNPTGKRLSLDQLVINAKSTVPEAKVVSAKLYSDPEKSIELGVVIPDKHKTESEKPETRGEHKAIAKGKEEPKTNVGPRATHTIFVNPYSGKVLELFSYKETFYYKMFALHRWLLGSPKSIGKYITGVSTFIFIFILLTGVILWWPKTRVILSQRLKVKWDGSFKRLNHDLHIVLGFYSSIFLFVFAFTALYWSFEWFNKGIFVITGTSKELPEPPSSILQPKSNLSFNDVYQVAQQNIKNVEYYNIKAPADSIGIYSVNVLPIDAFEMASNTYYINQYDGKILGSLNFMDKNLGQQVKSSIKPIHTGSIFGFPSKLIAFIVCLLGVTFPITGVIMWIKRLNKKKKPSKVLVSA